MNDKSKATGTEPQSITVGLIPTKIVAKESLEEFIELVNKFKEQHNATDEMTINAAVIFTVRDLD